MDDDVTIKSALAACFYPAVFRRCTKGASESGVVAGFVTVVALLPQELVSLATRPKLFTPRVRNGGRERGVRH